MFYNNFTCLLKLTIWFYFAFTSEAIISKQLFKSFPKTSSFTLHPGKIIVLNMAMKFESVTDNLASYDSLLFLSSRDGQNCKTVHNSHENCSWNALDTFLDRETLQFISTSSDNEQTSNRLPGPQDMKYWILAAFVLIYIRKIVEKKIFTPLGKRIGIKDHIPVDKIPCRCPNAVASLNHAYNSKGKRKLDLTKLNSISKKTGLSLREIERWMRIRKRLDKPSTLVKFSESGWRFVCYVSSTTIGLLALWNKPYFWNWQLCWDDYPDHEFPDEINMYYLFGSGLYISFLFTQFADVKRKDFWEMLFHHVITISLLTVSILLNLTRIAMITLILHDCADIFIESAKMANYAKKDNLATGIFAVFTLIWIITRLIVLPQKIIYEGGWLRGFELLPYTTAWGVIGMITFLFALHLFWTYFILKVVVSAIKSGPENQKDSRSSTESESDKDHDITVSKMQNEKVQSLATGKESYLLNRKLSLQCEEIANTIIAKQRVIMKRISVEIM